MPSQLLPNILSLSQLCFWKSPCHLKVAIYRIFICMGHFFGQEGMVESLKYFDRILPCRISLMQVVIEDTLLFLSFITLGKGKVILKYSIDEYDHYIYVFLPLNIRPVFSSSHMHFTVLGDRGGSGSKLSFWVIWKSSIRGNKGFLQNVKINFRSKVIALWSSQFW